MKGKLNQLKCSTHVSSWYCDGLLHYNNKEPHF